MNRRLLRMAIEIGIVVCAAGSIGATARASIQFVASADALAANDSLDWSAVGSAGSYPTSPIHAATVLANQLVVSLAISNAAIVQQGGSWAGSFPPGTYALYNQGSGDYTIQFGNPVSGFGTTLDDGSQQAFAAEIEAFAGATSLGVFPASANAHTVLFLGVSDSAAEITSVTLHDQTNNAFAIGPLSLITTVPEASRGESFEAAAAALTGLVALRRRG